MQLDEIKDEIIKIEKRQSYDLFRDLYCPETSLDDEFLKLSQRYYKLQELVYDKSRIVERLWEIMIIIRKPEVKITLLLSILDNETSKLIENNLIDMIDGQGNTIEELYNEYDELVEKIRKDNIKYDVMDKILENNKFRNIKQDRRDIVDIDEYWRILKQYFYSLRDRGFLNSSIADLKEELLEQNVINKSCKREQIIFDLKQIRQDNCKRN